MSQKRIDYFSSSNFLNFLFILIVVFKQLGESVLLDVDTKSAEKLSVNVPPFFELETKR